MASSNIYVTPSTTLILIKSLALSTNVLLPTLNVPNFEVKIRDTTGSSTLIANPITISTTAGAKFVDNTTSYSINQPYGFVNVGLRNSNSWQILHTSGQKPSESAANVGITSISTSYFSVLSTAQKLVSSLVVENLNTPNSITLQGPFIVGNLSTPGFIQLQSTLNVYGNVTFDRTLFVSGATQFLSSVSVETLLPLSSVLRSYSSVGAGGSLFVGESVTVASTFQTRSTLQVNTLAVQKMSLEKTTEIGNLQVAGSISTMKELAVEDQTVALGPIQVSQTVSSLSGTFSTGTLITTGNLTTFGNLSTLSSVSFYSSFTTLSTLFLNLNLSTFSSVNVTNILSTNYFTTNLLSSGTSFSTAGDFTILSTFTVKGTLSSSEIIVGNLFSTAEIVVQNNVSTFQSAIFSSFVSVDGFANLYSLSVGTDMGIGQNLDVQKRLFVDSINIEGDALLGNLDTGGATIIRQNVGVESDIFVKGNVTVLGVPNIGSFNVGNYEVSTLQIITSSPSVALRVSSLTASTIVSKQAKLVYSPTSGSIDININNLTPTNSVIAEKLYANTTKTNYLTTNRLYTDSVLNQDSLIPNASLPKFELYQKAHFPRGLSAQRIVGSTITADILRGNFIGDGTFLSDVFPPFSTLSANVVTASTVTTTMLSTLEARFSQGLTVSSMFLVSDDLRVGPLQILSTGLLLTSPLAMETLNDSLLGVQNILFLDSSNRRVGINTSTPRYNLDIRGSLYYTGQLFYSSINTLFLSTIAPNISFSTILYSSIGVQDSIILPQRFSPSNVFESITFQSKNPTYSTQMSFLGELNFLNNSFSLGEYYYPALYSFSDYGLGFFTNQLYSTITLGTQCLVYNNTKNVGIRTIQAPDLSNITVYIPSQIPSSIDLLVKNEIQVTELSVSTLTVSGKVITSTILMPQLGIKSPIQSTFNTINPANVYLPNSNFLFWTLRIDNFVDFWEVPGGKTTMFINNPSFFYFNEKDLYVYSNAFVSTLNVTDRFEANSIILGIQDL